jgi:hypothetical protein
VQPWDASSIRLEKSIDGSDYINPSPITLTSEIPDTQKTNSFLNGPLKRRYIAAQGPTEGTAFQFWQMVLQETQDSGVIIMLARRFKRGRDRCSRYFPTDMKIPSMTIRAPVLRKAEHGGESKGEVSLDDEFAAHKLVTDTGPNEHGQLDRWSSFENSRLRVTNLSGDTEVCLATIDTGISVNVVSREVVESLGIPINAKGRGALTRFSGETVRSEGTVQLLIHLPQNPVPRQEEFYVLNDLGAHQTLLSGKTAMRIGYIRRPADIPGSAHQRVQGGEKKDEAAIREPPRTGIVGSLPSNPLSFGAITK